MGSKHSVMQWTKNVHTCMFQQGLDGLGSMITLSQVEIEDCSDVRLITEAKVDQAIEDLVHRVIDLE